MRKQWRTPGGTAAAVCLDMLKQPHLLIAGSTGSGKSVLINSLIYTALYKSPNQCKFILIDPKRVELIDYKPLPHTISYNSEMPNILDALQYSIDLMISIHAPTRGATYWSWYGFGARVISIHAPTRGATLMTGFALGSGNDFNPRPYTRGDRECEQVNKLCRISIHAPTRGATSSLEEAGGAGGFQSTPLHEGRLVFPPSVPLKGDFNPRPYTRGDQGIFPSKL